ncbi:MAG TPA: hypothetical protein PKB15_02150 [Acidimicrobiia bacterium]|nr:hypothetical protein [Acidimicrobiia bacterium]
MTLEDDVAQGLRQRAKEKKQSFKVVVNDVLRAGLAAEHMQSGNRNEDDMRRKEILDHFDDPSRVTFSKMGIPTIDSGEILIPHDMPASLALELYEEDKPL